MGDPRDEEVIKKLMASMEEAWNRHNMKAWSEAFADDADFVNVFGTYRNGRAAIEKLHVEQHRGPLKNTKQHYTDITIRFLRPDVAVVHRYWSMSGTTDPAGLSPHPHNGVATNVMIKQNGNWLIAAFQNTIIRE